MWMLFIPLACAAVLMVVNNRRSGARRRGIDAALLAVWLLNLAAVFLAMGWRSGLLGIAISIACEPFVMKHSDGPSAQ